MAIPGSYSRELGQQGFDRIADTLIHHADNSNSTAGNPGTSDGSNNYHADVQKWIAVKVIGSAVFAAGTKVAVGDKPDPTDTLLDGDIIQGPFTKIQLSSGTVYAYRS